MNVSLAYGKGRISLDVPDHAVVIAPQDLPGLPDEHDACVHAMRHPIGSRPLHDLVPAGASVAIVIADMTRPLPSERLVPWIMAELPHIPKSNYVIISGTGSHRPNTRAELIRQLGEEIVDTVRVVNHNAFDESAVTHLGTSSYGGEVWVNNEYLRADVRIVTGFIEPHFYAGFSGGPKGVVPGVAGIKTILHLHNAQMIGHPRATWATLAGNPIQGEVREAVAMAPPEFMLNVALNNRRGITAAWAGHYIQAHEIGCRFVAGHAMRGVDSPFDIVITTNSGYPLDQNVYQSTKGMTGAATIVRQGGAILMASECGDGLPAHGNFQELLTMRQTPADLLAMIEAPGFSMLDQWAAQSLALARRKADIFLYSALEPELCRRAMLTPTTDLAATLAELLRRYGPQARIAVLPEGPQTVPYVNGLGAAVSRRMPLS